MTSTAGSSQSWKTPDEIIRLHRLKQKKKALQARVNKPNVPVEEQKSLLEASFAQKRKNPFAKSSTENVKKAKSCPDPIPEAEDSLLQLLRPVIENKNEPEPEKTVHRIKLGLQPFDRQNFANLLQDNHEEDVIEEQKYSKYLPVDWNLKTRLRILSKEPLPGTNLKSGQEASGLTSFVRCVDAAKASTSLDISTGARFHQATLYWQHPSIPWLTLFPRNSKANIGFQIGEVEKEGLAKDWADSFRGVFQLVRARQCPYFYMCANSFTVLFRAAGIGGRMDIHAMLTPSSRGLRNMLRQEEIEFTQPFKKDASLNKSSEENSSFSKTEEAEQVTKLDEENDDDDDLEEEKWLESLGVDASEIKKIHATHTRQTVNQEAADDFSDNSLLLIEGIDCQALFNFLLNAKSTVSNTGRLAGIPPTLLAPVAFPGATIRRLQTRSSKVRMDAVDYFSIDLRGVVLPHVLHYTTGLLGESCESFSATLSAHPATIALSKASQKLIEEMEKENNNPNEVFGKENLSDCGLQPHIIEAMCRIGPNAVNIMERMCYQNGEGYAWS